MSRGLWIAVGTTVAVAGVGGVMLYSRRASAASLPGPAPAPGAPPPAPPVIDLDPLPSAEDVEGDLLRNWGETPVDLRPLFMLMEKVSTIKGSARLFAVYSYREARFITTAHNGDAENEQAERDSTRLAYNNNKDRNPPLRYGEQAADFGSGGLFGLSAPYFLWTGVPEVGDKAPLLRSPPELVFQPRASAFGAVVYMQRLLKNYRIDDNADIRAGWASPSLLTTGRGSQRYHETRNRFFNDAKTLGIDLNDTDTIPSKLTVASWPGVLAVFAALVGKLPAEVA